MSLVIEKWNKTVEIDDAYSNFIKTGFDVILSIGSVIPIIQEDLEQYTVVLNTYTLGDYIIDNNDKKWYLTFDELKELVNTINLEIKFVWVYRNDLISAIDSATTESEVNDINWNVPPIIYGEMPLYQYYTKDEINTALSHYTTTFEINQILGNYVTVPVYSEHIYNSSNPHDVTAEQVGSNIAQWNAKYLNNVIIDDVEPTQGQILKYDSITGWTPSVDIGVRKKQATYRPRGDGGTTSWSKHNTYEYTVNVNGASIGDCVIVNPNDVIFYNMVIEESNIMMNGYVSDVNTVKIIIKVEEQGNSFGLNVNDSLLITCI